MAASQAPVPEPNITPGAEVNYTAGPERNRGPQLSALSRAEEGLRVCRPTQPNKVTVTLRQIEEQTYPAGKLSRHAGFQASALVKPMNGTVSSGTGPGHFLETADLFIQDNEPCQQQIKSQADGEMMVHVKRDISEVEVVMRVSGLRPLGRNPECDQYTGVHEGPSVQETCTFLDVDLARGGVYRDENYEDYADDDERRLNSCELDMGPIR